MKIGWNQDAFDKGCEMHGKWKFIIALITAPLWLPFTIPTMWFLRHLAGWSIDFGYWLASKVD